MKNKEKTTKINKETPTVAVTPIVEKKATLKERISEVVEKHEDKDQLKKAIFDLIQRVQFPEQFCPDCDDRLFLTANSYECVNCGYSRQATITPTVPTRQPITTQPVARPTGKVPEAVEKAIQMANENMQDMPRSAAPSKRGEQIRKLAEQLGDSTVPPTKQDEEILKGSDPNVREVNWV